MVILLSPGNYFGVERKCLENNSFKFNITQYDPFSEISAHSHENAYLSLLINGNYKESGNSGQNLVDPGQILFRPSGYQHANQFLKLGGRCFNIELKKELLEKYELMAAIPGISVTYKTGSFEDVYKAMYSFYSDGFVSLSEEYIFTWLTEKTRYKIPLRLVWLSKVKTILENEFETHHSIESVAGRVFVHPMYLARAFKEKEGLTFGEYQLKMRLEKAMELLFKKAGSVNDIACSAGFSDASHLVRSFRLHYQVTPAKFRLALKS
jgi:AraC family transcriptional regulator